MAKINWFPGHMARTVRQLKDIKNIDLVLEVVDARAIDTSKNNELTVGINKPKLTIALKSDLADTSSIKNKNILIGSIKNKSFKAQILAAIYDTFKDKLVNLKRKGLLIPQFYILVVGLPNVGKTSLINLLSSGAKLIAENRPGVTKRKQLIKINENFLLYDTPGVMVKNVETEKEGFTLSLINVINKNILPLNEVTEWGFNFYKENYFKEIQKYFGITENTNYHDFISLVCSKYKFTTNNGEQDIERAMDFIFKQFINCSICKVNYEI